MAKNQRNGPFKDHLYRNLGPNIRLCQLNIEGISRAKCHILRKILDDNRVDVLAVQEHHVENETQLSSRGKIPGFDLLGATFDKVYGVATYVRSSIENAYLLCINNTDNIHEVVIKIGDITIVNIYKPPVMKWPAHVIKTHTHPTAYLGDFNSHHELWKYRTSDENGNVLVNWSEEHNIHLVFDAKDRCTFRSAAWKTVHNPDLCFVSSDGNGQPLPVSRRVLDDFPHSQHRPVLLVIGKNIPVIRSFPRARWNFKKANWSAFSKNLDKCVGWIPPVSSSYNRFVGAVICTAKKCIPRGYRKEYIPGWTQQSEELYKKFCDTNENEIADELLHSIDAARRAEWTETVESLDFRTSSRKAWSLLRKLGGGNPLLRTNEKVTPSQVADHIVSMSRAPHIKAHTKNVRKDLTSLKSSCVQESEFSRPFNDEEITTALKQMKIGKAPGFDGIHSEFLVHSGQYVKTWLAAFFTDILQTGNIPHDMKSAKIIALLKPGRPNDQPKSYRPIALLSMLYKLLERLLYNRISHTILQYIPVEQAGFRPNRSCVDQVLSLTTFIEASFQKKQKTSAVFIDLTAAYDTVWRHGIIYKLLQVVPCLKIGNLLNSMLSNRSFQVVMGNKISPPRKLNNGLPQGSVLAPLLFSLYIADIPETTSRKFGYADDWALAVSHKDLDITESILTRDLSLIGTYFRKWKLQPNAAKTEVTTFHLNNRLANKELQIQFEGRMLQHNRNPKFLGVILDRTLSFKHHLSGTAAKINTRNNILQKLCGTTWGSSAITLRISALGLVYPVAEYCAAVWINSAHTRLVDVQLNQTMRIITGTLKNTPTFWLPILSHIEPPSLRRECSLVREFKKITASPELPVHEDIPAINTKRLHSRHPPLQMCQVNNNINYNIRDRWTKLWQTSATKEQLKMPCIKTRPPGFDKQRKIWTTLNRIRTNCGRCADSLHKWGMTSSPRCDCGAERQTVQHIVQACSLRAFYGDPQEFLFATDKAIEYIINMDICL